MGKGKGKDGCGNVMSLDQSGRYIGGEQLLPPRMTLAQADQALAISRREVDQLPDLLAVLREADLLCQEFSALNQKRSDMLGEALQDGYVIGRRMNAEGEDITPEMGPAAQRYAKAQEGIHQELDRLERELEKLRQQALEQAERDWGQSVVPRLIRDAMQMPLRIRAGDRLEQFQGTFERSQQGLEKLSDPEERKRLQEAWQTWEARVPRARGAVSGRPGYWVVYDASTGRPLRSEVSTHELKRSYPEAYAALSDFERADSSD